MYFNFCFYIFTWYFYKNTSSAIGLKINPIAVGIINYKSIIKKKKKLDKIVLLAKSNLISKELINSNVSHDEFVLITNLQKEFDDKKKN